MTAKFNHFGISVQGKDIQNTECLLTIEGNIGCGKSTFLTFL
jgi:translation initiation factor RLI1